MRWRCYVFFECCFPPIPFTMHIYATYVHDSMLSGVYMWMSGHSRLQSESSRCCIYLMRSYKILGVSEPSEYKLLRDESSHSALHLSIMHIFPGQLLLISILISIASIFVCSVAVVKYWRLKKSLHGYPSQLPMNPGHIRLTMADTQRFQIVGDHEEEDWGRLFPQGYGFAYLGDNFEMFGVSMFHQFHCLQTVRQAIIDRDIYGHAQHCLTYLRNSILCSADLTLEPQFEHGKVDGLGVTHQCRNWTAVYEWLDDNYAKYRAWNSTNVNNINSEGAY